MLKKISYSFLLTWFLLISIACQTQQKGYKVIGVKDGDTIVLLQDNKPLTVRLYGVDSPEKAQDFGTQAKNFTSDMVFGKYVTLASKGNDRYGRTIGEIALLDGRSLNKELVANGFAWYYRAYANDPKLGYLENDARRLEKGLWSHPNPTPPWDFRKDKRKGGNKKEVKATAPLPADAAREVFICPGGGAKTYHVKKDCSALNRCKGQIETVTLGNAEMNLHLNPCKICSK